ncbi:MULTISPECIES: hypothetical protein [Peribacillus]|uniref:hypothetical protein n=1 Tax=Peribacillus TaxID=2675229 RepID=UPI001F4E1058|nr:MULTISPECIES: hypothetical protein [unclassified Peribacillus]MCK1983705.1 hypothetical protein [Peribacillus sp. Aquil_B1]MCK2011400.1 hypothetical protein [Peribacillus sp. Aquil_B8]
MLWKISFWLIIAISIASMFVEAVHGPVLETIDTVVSIISTIGLFGYVYNKQLLSKSFWKFVFIRNPYLYKPRKKGYIMISVKALTKIIPPTPSSGSGLLSRSNIMYAGTSIAVIAKFSLVIS